MISPRDESARRSPSECMIALGGPPPHLDAEFKPKLPSSIFEEEGLPIGRCLGSKSAYRQLHPRSFFIPNSNIFCRRHGKVWWGDIDLRVDKSALEKVARRLRCRLFVLRESDGRFKEATAPHETVVRYALWHTGGATRVPEVRRLLRRSGLTRTQFALLAKLRRGRLTSPQKPEIALEVHRRLVEFDEVFGAIGADLGYVRWGAWWTSAHERLGGESPIVVLQSGRTVRLGELLDDKHLLLFFGLSSLLAKRL